MASISFWATCVASLAVSGVIFGQQFELGLLAVDHDALGIGFFNGQLGAVFVVLAEVGDLAGRRADVTDLDDDFLRSSRGRSSFRFCFRLFFLAAKRPNPACYGDCNRCESEFIGLFHVAESSEKNRWIMLCFAGCQRGNPARGAGFSGSGPILLVKYP